MIYVFDQAGTCLERNSVVPAPPAASFAANYGPGIELLELASDPYPEVPLASLSLVEGALTLDPAYEPPTPAEEPAPVDLAAELAQVKAAVAANILATAHDRKWLAQKETAKLVGIPYIQAHPECSQEEVEAAVVAALTAAYPGQAIVVSGSGIIQSYADEALARGYLSEASFAALRDLVAASTPAQVQAMLAVL